MNEFVKSRAMEFATLVHHGTRDYEKLTNLQQRLSKELVPYADYANRLEYLEHLEDGVKDLFRKHISSCLKTDTCPQHRTYNNALFLIQQEKDSITKRPFMIGNMSKKIDHKLDIFISHSSQDADTAKVLIELLRSALNIEATKIRCTSVSGYKLQAGASTDEQLRAEIFDARVFIGIISPNSVQSAYVAFELGARWGTKLHLVPLITSSLGAKLLEGPLKGINALNSCQPADVFQLVADIGDYLDCVPEIASVYQDKVNELVNLSLRETLPASIEAGKPPRLKGAIKDDWADAELIIKEQSEKEWPDDYKMQLHWIKQQKEALYELKSPKPTDVPETQFEQIRKKAMQDWPRDFVMQLHAQNEQISSIRQLREH